MDGYALGLNTNVTLFTNPEDQKADIVEVATSTVIFDNIIEYNEQVEFFDEVENTNYPWVVVFDFLENAFIIDIFTDQDKRKRFQKNFDHDILKRFWETYARFGVLIVLFHYLDNNGEHEQITGARINPAFIYIKGDENISEEIQYYIGRN